MDRNGLKNRDIFSGLLKSVFFRELGEPRRAPVRRYIAPSLGYGYHRWDKMNDGFRFLK